MGDRKFTAGEIPAGELALPEFSESIAHEAARLVITDGGTIVATMYAGADRIAVVGIDPVRAIGIGLELIGAAHRHLARDRARAVPSPSRGGDPLAEQRAERDEALRSLATMIAPAAAAEQQARKIAGRLTRFRPMANETAPERVLMQRVLASGFGVPSPERIRKILVKQKTRLDDQKPAVLQCGD
jgi:hypothetical protein